MARRAGRNSVFGRVVSLLRFLHEARSEDGLGSWVRLATASLCANCPAVTPTAPHTWI
jgi:hypothetical protein